MSNSMNDPEIRKAIAAVTQNPQSAEAWITLGNLMQARDEKDKAADCFQRARKLTRGQTVEPPPPPPAPVAPPIAPMPPPPAPVAAPPTSPVVQALVAAQRQMDAAWFPNLSLLLSFLFSNHDHPELADRMMWDSHAFDDARSLDPTAMASAYLPYLIGEMDAAEIAVVERAQQAAPDAPVIDLCLGFSYFRCSRREQVDACFARAQAALTQLQASLPNPTAREFYREVECRWHLGLARLFKSPDNVREYARAIELGGQSLAQFFEGLKVDPNADAVRQPLANAYLALAARASMERKDFARAIELGQQAVSLDPRCGVTPGDGYANLGLYYAQTDRLDQAIEIWERGLPINPGHLEMRQNLVLCYGKRSEQYQDQSQWTPARALLEKALAMERASPAPRAELIRQTEERLAYYERNRNVLNMLEGGAEQRGRDLLERLTTGANEAKPAPASASPLAARLQRGAPQTVNPAPVPPTPVVAEATVPLPAKKTLPSKEVPVLAPRAGRSQFSLGVMILGLVMSFCLLLTFLMNAGRLSSGGSLFLNIIFLIIVFAIWITAILTWLAIKEQWRWFIWRKTGVAKPGPLEISRQVYDRANQLFNEDRAITLKCQEVGGQFARTFNLAQFQAVDVPVVEFLGRYVLAYKLQTQLDGYPPELQIENIIFGASDTAKWNERFENLKRKVGKEQPSTLAIVGVKDPGKEARERLSAAFLNDLNTIGAFQGELRKLTKQLHLSRGAVDLIIGIHRFAKVIEYATLRTVQEKF